MFKQPKPQAITNKGLDIAVGTVGAITARGAEVFNITKNSVLERAIIGGTALLAGLAYKGAHKDHVLSFASGVAVYEAFNIADHLIKQHVKPLKGDGKEIAYLNKALGLDEATGLGCPCVEQREVNYPALNSPSSALLSFDENVQVWEEGMFSETAEDAEFTVLEDVL